MRPTARQRAAYNQLEALIGSLLASRDDGWWDKWREHSRLERCRLAIRLGLQRRADESIDRSPVARFRRWCLDPLRAPTPPDVPPEVREAPRWARVLSKLDDGDCLGAAREAGEDDELLTVCLAVYRERAASFDPEQWRA